MPPDEEKLRQHFRNFVHVKQSVRKKHLIEFEAWLEKHGGSFGFSDFQKLWKALFYCIWLSDLPRVQRATMVHVCRFLRKLPDEKVAVWLQAAFSVLALEYDSLDRYRVDKFALFLRMLVAESYHWLAIQGWSPSLTGDIVKTWENTLLARETREGRGLTKSVPIDLILHFLRVFHSELLLELREGRTAEGVAVPPLTLGAAEAIFGAILRFWRKCTAETGTVIERRVFDEFVENVEKSRIQDEAEVEADGEGRGEVADPRIVTAKEALRRGFVEAAISLAEREAATMGTNQLKKLTSYVARLEGAAASTTENLVGTNKCESGSSTAKLHSPKAKNKAVKTKKPINSGRSSTAKDSKRKKKSEGMKRKVC